jgi:flavin reductase (DIM6/NTAB) family NADH-FMN oxidoreductase RutF
MKLQHDMLTHGVNIVTAAHEGQRGGLAVAWATQVGIDHVLVCIGAQSATRAMILASGAFGVCVLAQEHLELARRFGGRHSDKVDKFEGLEVRIGETGVPLLAECALALECGVVATYDFGKEKLIVGQVVAAERLMETFTPLTYRQEDYH